MTVMSPKKTYEYQEVDWESKIVTWKTIIVVFMLSFLTGCIGVIYYKLGQLEENNKYLQKQVNELSEVSSSTKKEIITIKGYINI